MYKVLLVDDEYMILQGLTMIIDWQALGFDVVSTARSGQEALAYLTQYPVDVMISDVTMPGMTGLDLIEAAKTNHPQLQTLILSGYQEFSYVQKAMELETKGYLLKPVDKAELQAKMKQFKDWLDAQQAESIRQETYHDSLLTLWLTDELSEKEFHQLSQDLPEHALTGFTVLYVECSEWIEEMEAYFKQEEQPCYLKKEEDKKIYLAILLGRAQQAKAFTSNLQKQFSENIQQIILGETVDDWENVYESYNQVRQSLFYNSQMSQPTDKGNSKLEMPESRLQFFAFNKALMIGDEPTILAKLEAIFHEMKALNFSPEDVKHVSFLLFSDIYRQFPILDKMTYLSMVKTIHNSQSIDRILRELKKVLDVTNQNNSPEKRYSDLVSETIDCIRKEYHQELTLKAIADRLHVNGVYLGQCFKNETERSFTQYLNHVRIQKAQQLLLYTNQSINEIAYETGYNTNHYFIKMFKKLNGLSPKEFRDRYKDNYQAIKGDQ
ncbi:TPA: response regulator transcription factor [Streptococcus pyogenes]|uniref:response regulator transcription factor n=1 Tax=Streptococcus pyogenes TaxID=1314 RepID=UPI000057BEA0|nr:response regulator transcription factor [Streptococcus pyogenes]EQL81399.1 response regulator receiver domain protein [Streptococcus pyogenes UTSW-2]ESA59070.1 response regulator receiver domain protein [Streptococcus pyogenes GA40377]HER4570556.1 response regulator transcription factor [Streptococcus pyogenes NGAS653]HER4724452.1 response regulator transcription factor [Streptococcus pyogenes NGAS302]HER4731046.1 response regulator transcription factor [Streptococcus pyogenes NGAS304]HER4